MIIDFHVEIGDNIYYDVSFNINELMEIINKYSVAYTVITPSYGRPYLYGFAEANKNIYILVKKYSNLIGFGTANPWYLYESLKEIDNIFNTYKLAGIKLIPYLQGYSMNHKIVYPIVERLSKYRGILYVPSGYHPQTPLEIADLADVFPDIIIVMGYAGLTDFWMEVLPAMKGHDNIYADLSCQSNVRVIKEAIMGIGSERFLFASSMPYSNIEVELKKIELLNLSEYDKENILWRNAKRLLKGFVR